MASTDIDTIIHIYNIVESKLIGHSSAYSSEPHPGTNSMIEGWKWDERTWPSEGEFKAAAYAPSIWDPTTSGIDESLFQSGYGDNKDLLLVGITSVLSSDDEVWAPQINHGYFYTHDEEWYLYSDSYLTEYFTVTGVESGRQVLTLTHPYKPTIPIQVRNYRFNRSTGRHETLMDFTKKVEFTTSGVNPEFTVDTTTNPPKLVLNGQYNRQIGVPQVPGTTSANDLDVIGFSNGEYDQGFNLTYSPIDPSQAIEVWVWSDPDWPTEWTVIDPLDNFAVSGTEVKVDKDRGTLAFASSGIVPSDGVKVGAYYTRGLAAMYEPEGSSNYITAFNSTADTNPVTSAVSRGFIQVATESVEPTSIVLTSDLTRVNPYIIQLGNNTGSMIAEVRSISQDLLEGQQVTFEIIDPIVGTLGGSATIGNALTGTNGQASLLYNSPATIQDVGGATSSAVYQDGTDTLISITGVSVSDSTVSGVYLYKIHETDETLGMAESDVDTYYTDYITEQEIVSGVQATNNFEIDWRTAHGLGVPTAYAASNISTGKKTLMLTTRGGTMNPHSGAIEGGILVPLLPDSITNVGTDEDPIYNILYENQLLDLPGTNDTKAYFVVGDSATQVRAYVTNSRTNKRVYSNTIDLEVQIPDSINGSFFCDTLNDISYGMLTRAKNINNISTSSVNATSGVDEYWQAYSDEKLWVSVSGIYETYEEWFRRTRRSDTVGLMELSEELSDPTLSGIEIITPVDYPAEIPMGFRLKSTGITVASILDQVTFLDPNDYLPSGYHGV